ncbi:hypothetical protein MHPYR_620037 [uncultured Mycobacterium sp.]|uniref:Uncharacterized protein n=1 Tax=uncultured Mycobacterium sp. TaxID=171292 RepID=A0A1Y5PRQ0_9MYCO|nr:hypothetical protein MHPYR_620037 [uncultured Mycobacterium sp.]
MLVIESRHVTVIGTVCTTNVSFCAHPLDHVRVMQLESGPLRTDPGQFGEVVPRRRA